MNFLIPDDGFPSLTEMLFYAYNGGKTVEDTATGNPLTFTTDVSKPLKSLLIPFTPIQSGTGDPSPENIRPILPWNGLTVFGGGKNLLNPAWWDDIADNKSYVRYEDGTLVYQAATYKASDYVSVIGNTEYTLHAVMSGQGAGGIAFYDSSKQYISGIQINSSTITDHTFTTPSNVAYMRFWDNGGKMPWDEVMLVCSSTAPTAYVPYVPITETDISFPSPVYGGTLDVVSGVLTVTHGLITLTGNEGYSWKVSGKTVYTSDVIFSNIQMETVYIDGFCSACPNSNHRLQNFSKNGNGGSGVAFANTDTYWGLSEVSGEALDAMLQDMNTAGTPLQVAYPLAEPQTVQLTAEQITALLGNNTIWSDADGQMTATYLKKG